MPYFSSYSCLWSLSERCREKSVSNGMHLPHPPLLEDMPSCFHFPCPKPVVWIAASGTQDRTVSCALQAALTGCLNTGTLQPQGKSSLETTRGRQLAFFFPSKPLLMPNISVSYSPHRLLFLASSASLLLFQYHSSYPLPNCRTFHSSDTNQYCPSSDLSIFQRPRNHELSPSHRLPGCLPMLPIIPGETSFEHTGMDGRDCRLQPRRV